MIAFTIITLIALMDTHFSKKRPERAGCIPITSEGLVILINSRQHNNFILPKGKVEKGETPLIAAERETFEEAGVKGAIFKKPILVYKNISWFLMLVKRIEYDYMENYRDRIFILLNSVLNIKNIKIKRDIKYVLAKLLNEKKLLGKIRRNIDDSGDSID